MKYLIIAIVLGGLGYFVFFSGGDEDKKERPLSHIETENQKIRDEMDIKNTSYQGAMMETYNMYKGAVQGAHDAADSIEAKQYSLD